MWPFKKKTQYKIYRVVWKYDSTRPEEYAEYVSAIDKADAWARVRRGHNNFIHCDSIEEVKENVQQSTQSSILRAK